jgi:putative two-component system response regulator
MEDQKATILIVDDELVIRKLLRQKLTREGYCCREADSVDGAMKKLEDGLSELIISDIMMPEKTGIELLAEVKARYPDISFIMATAVAEMSIAIQCLKDGADDYICKPFDLNQVLVSVQRCLEKRSLQLSMKDHQHLLEDKVEWQTTEIRKISLGAIEALVYALEAKDKYTAGHSRRVTNVSVAIGKAFGLADEDIEDLRWGSLLHDVGKIAVSQMVQNKPDRLTKEEYEHIMIHAHVGAGIVKPVVNERVVEIVEHHHDHFDGGGIHQTVRGTDIPLGARILAVADAFDAMTSNRPYRLGMPVEDALKETVRCSGSQFDPQVVTAFLELDLSAAIRPEHSHDLQSGVL